MAGTTRLRFVALLCGLLMFVIVAKGDVPKVPVTMSDARRNALKIPTKIRFIRRGDRSRLFSEGSCRASNVTRRPKTASHRVPTSYNVAGGTRLSC
jgi:hypothetical protein